MSREITKRALKGDRFEDLHIMDSHCHMGDHYSFYFPKADIGQMLQDADALGVEKICIAPHAAISCDYRLGNAMMKEAVCKYPERVLGLLVLNPNKLEEMDAEFDNYYQAAGIIGIKLHPGLHRYNINSGACFRVYEKVFEHGGYIMTHTWETSPYCRIGMCEDIIKAFPGIPFVLGHAGGVSDGVEKSIKLANTYENAYFDTSGFEYSDTWLEEIVEKTDAAKILFGSDYPFHDIRGGISRILLADIDDGIKAAILSENFNAMLIKYPKKDGGKI